MTFVGIILMLKDKSDRWVLMLTILVIAYCVAVSGVGPVGSRLRVVFMPILYFLSSYGLVWVGEVFQKYKERRSWNEKTS